jgi:hypothetical protein
MDAPYPPFGTPSPMTVRLVADIQNRLFWRVGTGRASECCVPSAGWSQASRVGSDVPAEQRLQGFDPLRCCRQGLNRGDFLGPAEEADVWFEPNVGSADGLETFTAQVEPSYVTCGNVRLIG